MNKSRFLVSIFLSAVFAGSLWAQTSLQVRPAELAIPFGAVKGQLLVVGEYLLFVDSDRPEGSFAISRGQIDSLEAEQNLLKIVTNAPVEDRSGSRSELVFKLKEALDLAPWLEQRQVAAGTAPSAPAPQAEEKEASRSYAVSHKHRFGNCQGRLLIGEAGLAFESVGDLSHSRKWSFGDIKKLKLENPYELRIEPFAGNGYTLKLQGQGMESDVYQSLVDRVTASRAGL